MAMEEMGDAKALGKVEEGAGGTVVADAALGLGTVEDAIGIVQQPLDRGPRDGALSMMIEDELALAIGESHQPDRHAVAVGDRFLQVRLRRDLVDARLVGSRYGARDGRG